MGLEWKYDDDNGGYETWSTHVLPKESGTESYSMALSASPVGITIDIDRYRRAGGYKWWVSVKTPTYMDTLSRGAETTLEEAKKAAISRAIAILRTMQAGAATALAALTQEQESTTNAER